MARWKATGEYIPNLSSKKNFVSGPPEIQGGSDVTGDVGSAYTPGKSVLCHRAFCSSYRDER